MGDPERPLTTDVHAAAVAWCTAGYSVIRVATDGTKATLGRWKDNQEHAAPLGTVTGWFKGGHPGLGIVCGPVSGNVELLEIEGRAVVDGTGEQFLEALDQHGLSELKTRILRGYSEQSPSGGIHLLYRVDGDPVPGNTKLAQRPNPDPDATPKTLTLIETRGNGGYVVVAPSHGPVHPSGRPWVLVAGGPDMIAVITAEERAALHSVARLFDQMPPPPPIPDPVPINQATGTPPGADFNSRASWDDVLIPAGWVAVQRSGTRTLWRRPGKRLGISAVTGGASGDYLYVWSTSTELPAEQGLSKWRTYALLRHSGDFAAAAKALAASGYGQRSTPEQPHRPVLTVLPGLGAHNGAQATARSLPEPGATTPARTDDALALTLVDEHGAGIRYCAERGRWLTWSGHQWTWCTRDAGPVREHVKRIARTLPEDSSADVRHKIHALSAPGTTHIVNQAASDPRVIVALSDLDARPYELNTPDGVIDFRTGALLPADPSRLHTRITRASPDPGADHQPWSTFLARTFAGQPELTAYIQRLAGYSATGAVRDHVLPFAYGAGANGKSVLLGVVARVLGDYATTAPAGFLMAQQYAKHETELAHLAGARFVVCSEINEGDRFDEARVKLLTGKDAITARFMRQDYFTFEPTHHLWLAGNYQPTITAGGPAFWRRVRIIPFANTVPPAEQNPDLSDELSEQHGSAVLAWIVAGAVAYLTHGLSEPETVHMATAGYEREQDTIAQFLDDCCRIGGGEHVRIRVGALRAAYERWCHQEGWPPCSAKALGTALARLPGVAVTRSNGVRLYIGLSLTGSAAGSERDTERDTPPGAR